ncbi:MAG: OmpA family protein [Paracoccaceae bacterium]
MLAQHLNKYPSSNVQVIGHTDNQGAASYNLNLSRQRAAAVTQVLMNQGVAPQRVTSIGRGEDQPIASSLPQRAGRRTARVEIIIIPTS